MSWRATSYVTSIVDNITPAEKLVLLVLSNYFSDRKHAAWPSVATLARQALMSERHARRLLKKLAGKGFISIQQSAGRRSNSYTFPGYQPGHPDVSVEECEPGHKPLPNPDKTPPQPGHPDVSRTEEQRKEPSQQAVRESSHPKKANRKIDPREAPFRQKLEKFLKYMKAECRWVTRDSDELRIFLEQWPALTLDRLHEWLGNYDHSDDIKTDRTPRQILFRLNEYATGPHDKYGKEKSVD